MTCPPAASINTGCPASNWASGVSFVSTSLLNTHTWPARRRRSSFLLRRNGVNDIVMEVLVYMIVNHRGHRDHGGDRRNSSGILCELCVLCGQISYFDCGTTDKHR